MRHGKRINHLSRKSAHRKAMLANMACSLIEHKRINTTVAKAKALRMYVEPIINRAKTDSTHSRRMVFRSLRDKYAVQELFRTVGPAITDRDGGYTRIIKTGFRPGDAADMCLIELVDFNDLYGTATASKKKRTRRGGAKKKAEDVVATGAAAVADKAVEVAEKTAEAVSDTVEEVSEAAEEVAEATTEQVAEATQEATEAADEAADESKDDAENSDDENKA
ncbi:MAG: 50S ribosomal protein L17 [Flavobacteriales bacterium]|nr:50S ribosomal protein L17 [Flavobacteriales bacterium]